MKKLFPLIISFFLIENCLAITPTFFETPPKIKASALMVPIGKTANKISLLELANISKSDLEKLTGNKMNYLQRLSFKIAQLKIKKMINKDGFVKNRRLLNALAIDGETGFHLGGFALGFLLSLIGVLIAYLINDDKKKNRVKYAWIGFGANLVLSLILAFI